MVLELVGTSLGRCGPSHRRMHLTQMAPKHQANLAKQRASKTPRVVRTGFETPMAEALVGKERMGVFGVLRGRILALRVTLMVALIGMCNIREVDITTFIQAVGVGRRRK